MVIAFLVPIRSMMMPPISKRRNGSDAVTGIQPAKLRGGESEVIDEDSFQRVDAVIDVVVPPLRQTDEHENRPPV